MTKIKIIFLFGLSYQSTGLPFCQFLNQNTSFSFGSGQSLALNSWQHVAFTFSYPNAFVFLNGVLTGSGYSSIRPSNINRTRSFIGKSSWYLNGLQDVQLDLDELLILKRAMSHARDS